MKSSYVANSGFDIDHVIAVDFSMLKSILGHLLTKDAKRDEASSAADFKIEILKNRVDQLVVDKTANKKEIEEL
jgi:hypothetical protein